MLHLKEREVFSHIKSTDSSKISVPGMQKPRMHEQWLWHHQIQQGSFPAASLTHCGTLRKLLRLSENQFLYLYNGADNNMYSVGLVQRLRGLILTMLWTQKMFSKC